MSKNLRFTEDDLLAYQARNINTPTASYKPREVIIPVPPIPDYGLKEEKPPMGVSLAQKKRLVIVLPFKLPTWNFLLNCHPFKRKKVRDFLHLAVSIFTPKGKDSLTPMEYREKQLSMASFIAGYLKMMTQGTSEKSATPKKKAIPKKRR